jgi:phage/plasmid-associated DNA primase
MRLAPAVSLAQDSREYPLIPSVYPKPPLNGDFMHEPSGDEAIYLRVEQFEKGLIQLTDTDRLDTNPWLFNVENGTIDLKTGELREHRHTSEQSMFILYGTGANGKSTFLTLVSFSIVGTG